jgi:hypothetical protein
MANRLPWRKQAGFGEETFEASGGTCVLKPLFVGVNKIHEGLNVVAVSEAGGFFPRLEARLHFGIILFGIVEHPFAMGGFDGIGLLNVFQHPIADFAVGDGVLDHVDELLRINTGGFEPAAIKAFAEVGLIIGVQLAGEMKADFVNETGQVHPAAHGFARTTGINDVAHWGDDLGLHRRCQ